MNPSLPTLALVLLALPATACAASMTLVSPLDHQVIQRSSRETGRIRIAGSVTGIERLDRIIEVKLTVGNKEPAWLRLPATFTAEAFEANLDAPAGGWHRLQVRVSAGGKELAQQTVAHIGVGEVFVIAGQSNSANHGEELQTPQTGRVAAFDGTRWQLANDPQPGASGGGGSFMPPLGDALVKSFEVPVGFVACGIGATSVREWLPKGTTFPNPPTIESRVEKLPTGGWASKGEAFAMLVARMKQLGPRGCRAVLWHQGESDANQADPVRTLPGRLYREHLATLIRDSRREIGWGVPWFVAQVSYHIPGDEASPDLRAAQASLWRDGIALEGPDSDALKGELRERQGQGVHFSGKGLRELAASWFDKLRPWLDSELDGKPPGASGADSTSLRVENSLSPFRRRTLHKPTP